MHPWLTVVGIGEDGFAGLGRAARRALLDAAVVVGGARHLAMLPRRIAARREPWPTPFGIEPVLRLRGTPTCVLASGDPMCFGVGATLARALPVDEMRVLPAASSISLAAGRLGWPLQDVTTVSVVGRALASVARHLREGARLIVLSADGCSPAALAALLRERGFGATRLVVFEHLGGPNERRLDGCAATWEDTTVADLNLVALECRAASGARALPLTHGLPDEAFATDGQLTKRDVRAVTLARLAPQPGELLWDVGAGSGSIGIEWMRSHASCRAIAIEAHPQRQRNIEANREALGVPALQLVCGCAPDALAGLPAPDAIFVGGGVSAPGVLDACWSNLRVGGRLVANAVTLQSEALLVAWRARYGGTLTRIAIAQALPLGGFDTWRDALPVTLYEVVKHCEPNTGEGEPAADRAADEAHAL
jgi:precorrin-6Y C5,15-methyltransferase (decarboxylating)